MLNALLFDCDGTLADTERHGHRVAFNLAFEAAKLDWHWGEAEYGELLAVTGGKERIRHYLDRIGGSMTDAEVRALHQSKSEIFKSLAKSGEISLRPGVKRLILDAKREGLRMAIVTTTTEQNLHALLEAPFKGRANDYFELFAAGDVVEYKKPAPDIYLWAMEHMGLGPMQCLAVEDSQNGLQAAKHAGIESTLITYNDYTRLEDFNSASLVVDQLGNPDDPCRVQQGTISEIEFVSVSTLKQIHDQSVY